jgi:hypothetical protein
MHGHVFQCFTEGNSSNQFTRTVEALGEYVSTNMKNSGNMLSLTEDLVLPTIPEPGEPSTDTSEFKKEVWRTQVKSYVSRLEVLDSNLKTAYAVVWGQCSTMMRTKVKACADFKENNASKDCVWLLKAIKGVMLQFEGQQDIFLSLDDAVEKLYSYRQGPDKSIDVFRDEYILLIEVVEHYGGIFRPHPALLDIAKGSSEAAKLQ